MGDEGYVVAIGEADLALERAISLKFGPAMAGDFFALVVAVPIELDVVAMAGDLSPRFHPVDCRIRSSFDL